MTSIRMTPEQLAPFFDGPGFEHYRIRDLGERRLVLHIGAAALGQRPGASIDGPSIAKIVDVAGWLLLIGLNGPKNVMSYTTNLNLTFLKKGRRGDLLATATLLGRSRRTASVVVDVQPEDEQDSIAHATLTYALPRELSLPDAIALSVDELQPLVGHYRFAAIGKSVKVFIEQGELHMAELRGEPGTDTPVGLSLRLLPKSALEFFATEFEAQVVFHRTAEGTVTGMTQRAFSQTLHAAKES